MTTKELWSFRDQAVARVDLTGYELRALDGSLGTVAQSIEGSGGGCLVVDPGVAMPLGRQVLVPAGLVDKVDIEQRSVSVRADREQIRNAPAYESSELLDERRRRGMAEYYGGLMGEQSQARTSRAGKAGSRTSGSSRKSQARAGSSARTRSRRSADEPTKAELYAEASRLGIEGRSKMDKAQLARAVGRRRGGSARGGRSQAKANPVDVQAFLEGVGYPTGKRQLLREAEKQGARREVRATLRRLPDKNFESPTDVSQAIGRLA
jgi:uncharacterized protein DUF2795